MTSTFCINCGERFPDGANFCGNCGTARQKFDEARPVDSTVIASPESDVANENIGGSGTPDNLSSRQDKSINAESEALNPPPIQPSPGDVQDELSASDKAAILKKGLTTSGKKLAIGGISSFLLSFLPIVVSVANQSPENDLQWLTVFGLIMRLGGAIACGMGCSQWAEAKKLDTGCGFSYGWLGFLMPPLGFLIVWLSRDQSCSRNR
ncbi:MAG: zinc ribbon domain-containing protein [Armatimonadetes bacterium]|nr:zinc ribbon domain-containing protein [Armatimonadota bacterium]